MRNLTREQIRRRDELVKRLSEAGEAVKSAVETLNDTVDAAWERYQEVVAAYSRAIDEVEDLRDEVHTEMGGYADARSERWHDSDAGARYRAWRDDWSVPFEAPEAIQPDPVRAPDLGAADALRVLPEAP